MPPLPEDPDAAPSPAPPARPAPEIVRKRGATAPKPPACVGNGPPQSQRRAAIDFLSRELRTLEIEASHTAQLEDRIEILEAQCKRAEQTAQMFLRRCQMLEEELKLERARKVPPVAGASSLAAAAARLPTLAPKGESAIPTTLGAAAAMLPPPPTIMAPPVLSSTASVSDDAPLPPSFSTVGIPGDDDAEDFDIDARQRWCSRTAATSAGYVRPFDPLTELCPLSDRREHCPDGYANFIALHMVFAHCPVI